MSTSPSLVVERPASIVSRVTDYVELTKPRIAILVLVTVAMSSYIASWGRPDIAIVIHTLVGTALVAASASAGNQWLERRSDALMRRTAQRPLPAGRLQPSAVIGFTVITLVLGEIYLSWFVNWPTATWGLLTWTLYVCVYTPLKARSPWNTGVGAIGGAMPILMGWSAVSAPLTWRAAEEARC